VDGHGVHLIFVKHLWYVGVVYCCGYDLSLSVQWVQIKIFGLY